MPELPEVEIIRRELEGEVVGKRIGEVVFDEEKMLRPNPSRFKQCVEGKKIEAVSRRAKLLIFELKGDVYFACHLKLTGRLLYRQDSSMEDDYVHVVFRLQDGSELRFANARKFGYLQCFNDRRALKLKVDDYGPEPLDDLDKQGFAEILNSTGRMIKTLLMDQSKISGVGNIYANDALWMAGIHPQRPADSLTSEEVKRLFCSLEEVFEEALETGGSSDQWFRHTDGSMGRYQQNFKVYGRKGKECRRCGEEIVYDKIGGRGTFWCPECQENTGT